MIALRLACLAALAATLPIEGASAQDISGEIDLLELHSDLDETNFAIDAAFELRQNSRGVVLKAAGNGDIGPTMDELQTEALFLQQVGASTSLLLGVRHDFRPGGDLSYGQPRTSLERASVRARPSCPFRCGCVRRWPTASMRT